MNKDKQIIEEMAKHLRYTCEGECFRNKDGFIDCDVCRACDLYNAGYRKQSEWISVEERLPSESGKYLVCTNKGNVYQTKFYSYPEINGGHWGQKDKGKSITHWMPLPEAPKGGE